MTQPPTRLSGPRLSIALLVAALALAVAAPRAGAQAPLAGPSQEATRLVTINQIDATDAPIGKPTELACPDSGCQVQLSLAIELQREPFLASLQFVARGAYFTLTPLSIGTAEVLEFAKGRKGAVFLQLRGAGRHEADIAFTVVRSASVRALKPQDDGQTLASGPVFNRKRSPDLRLRISFAPPGG